MSYEARIPGYDKYTVSRDGGVYSTQSGEKTQLTPSTNRYGYLVVNLTKDGTASTKLVHRLVLDTFVGPCPPSHECRHINGVRTDNRVDNLMWGTRAENEADKLKTGTHNRGSRHGMAKLSDWDVIEIRDAIRTKGKTQTALAKIYGVSQSAISNINRGISWSHIEENK